MIAALLLVAGLGGQADTLAPRLLDSFERPEAWSAHPADGVRATLRGELGHRGHALRMDFDFQGGGGYAIARRTLPIDLPANYAFTFWLRATGPANTLEFKLVDASGENVWWYTERDRSFDGVWRRVTIRKRQITYAWGPQGGGELGHVAALELVITAGRGGRGTVWFDELELTPLPVAGPYTGAPLARAWSSLQGAPAALAVDGDTSTAWRNAAGGARDTATGGPPRALTIDFGRPREFGGLSLFWRPGGASATYDVQLSDDGRAWRPVRRVTEGNGGRDDLQLPDTETRWLRLLLRDALAGRRFALGEVGVQPLAWGATRNAYFGALAASAPVGSFPRYWSGRRAYWTVVGLDAAREEALFGEDGAAEVGKGDFSVEPFLRDGGRTLSWHDVIPEPTLEDGVLPIPATTWRMPGLSLTVTAFAVGEPSHPNLVLRYRLRNEGQAPRTPTLYAAVRPFQVNPPSQFLNTSGGAARIDSVRWTGRALKVNADRLVIPLTRPGAVGATSFDAGEIASHLLRGTLPVATRARDPFAAASAALAWPLTLGPGDSASVYLEVPLTPGGRQALPANDPAVVEQALAETRGWWHERLERTRILLPPSGGHLARTIESTLAWILVNRDGPSIQPGSRSYERSWIRDGSLTSAALLRFGHPEVVRDFVRWFAGFQYPSGKVPCCVDARGADPVPEHDSHGQLVYLVAEYWRHTGDTALVRELWPHVTAAVSYLDSLRQTRRTGEYRSGPGEVFFGLLPPSISHEGYSAKPMHSYWDDIFALRGFTDAARMAEVLGDAAAASRYGALRDAFRADLLASWARVMARDSIDYLPGAADLGDFDATSTTVAVSPGGLQGIVPDAALRATFARYWRQARARADSGSTWENYTPYELRTVGTLLRLGWPDRARALLEQFLADQEPTGWNQWPEVVWHDRRVLKFIGDSPHTWVGSDFLRSAADLFAYEDEADGSLVLGAGLDPRWLEGEGVRVERLGTWWGPLSYTARREETSVRVRLGAGLRPPPGGIRVMVPGGPPPRQVLVDGVAQPAPSDGVVLLRRVPAEVVVVY